MHCCGAVSHVGLVQGKCEANPRRARLDIRASPIALAERLLLAAKKRTKIVRLIELLLVSAALDSVDGAGNLVGAVVPEPTRVTETHRLVAGLRRRQTDFVVGGGVPELLNTRHISLFTHANQMKIPPSPLWKTGIHKPLAGTPNT